MLQGISTLHYRGLLYSAQTYLRRTQAGPGRAGRQQQEQISTNLESTILCTSVKGPSRICKSIIHWLNDEWLSKMFGRVSVHAWFFLAINGSRRATIAFHLKVRFIATRHGPLRVEGGRQKQPRPPFAALLIKQIAPGSTEIISHFPPQSVP